MILSCSNIKKSFGDHDVLKGGSFFLEKNERSAIVGINGAGKTTLLNIITGELEADSGNVSVSSGLSIGYLKQNVDLCLKGTIYGEVLKARSDLIADEELIRKMEAGMDSVKNEELNSFMEKYHALVDSFEKRGGYTYRSEVLGVIRGLGFSENELDSKIGELSGGQKTRVALCIMLVSAPDIIILDEPTNHLDIASCTWLENYLRNYRGTVLIVSHDRFFLDRVAQSIIELDSGQIRKYEGNYTEYKKKSEAIKKARLKAYENQQAKIRHEREVIEKLKSFNREKSVKRAESREKALDRLEIIDAPDTTKRSMRISFKTKRESGNDVLSVEGLSKSYGSKNLFSEISFLIRKGEKVALIGDNGTGKSTFLKIINGRETSDSGRIRLGANTDVAYYDQEQQELNAQKTIFEEMSDSHPELKETDIRNVLAAFLFFGDDVFKKIDELSGGERARVLLAKLMLNDANFIMLDEPTNHLDIISKESLEEKLGEYEGTLFVVSHDRYFINAVADRVLELKNGKISDYPGNFDYYLEKSMQNGSDAYGSKPVSAGAEIKEFSKESSAGKEDWKQQKEKAAAVRKREKQLEETESRIGEAEDRIRQLEQEMILPDVATNSARLSEIDNEMSDLNAKLEVLIEEWEQLLSEE